MWVSRVWKYGYCTQLFCVWWREILIRIIIIIHTFWPPSRNSAAFVSLWTTSSFLIKLNKVSIDMQEHATTSSVIHLSLFSLWIISSCMNSVAAVVKNNFVWFQKWLITDAVVLSHILFNEILTVKLLPLQIFRVFFLAESILFYI